jgi:hypothetical protein
MIIKKRMIKKIKYIYLMNFGKHTLKRDEKIKLLLLGRK